MRLSSRDVVGSRSDPLTNNVKQIIAVYGPLTTAKHLL